MSGMIHSLQNYVNKLLLVRLSIMVVVISILVGGLTYFYEYRSMQDYVADQADYEVQLLIARSMDIMAEKKVDGYEAFRQSLAESVARPVQHTTGHFVYAGFYKPNHELIDEYIDKSTAGIQELVLQLAEHDHEPPSIDSRHVENFQDQGTEYIYVIFPVVDQQKIAGYTHALYVLSDETLAYIHNNIRRSLVIALLIVLATGMLMYPVILRLVRRLAFFSGNLLDANLQSIALLGGTIAKRDSDTDAHNYRVSIYSVRLAEAIGLDTETIRSLIKGAFLHDVGKIGIRDNILLKPGKLNEEEFEVMKTHVNHGLDIVDQSTWLSDAKDVVGSHHEKFGGGGYPAGLRESEIPITARIFAIADVFDALTSRRPYKEPMSLEKTINILSEGKAQHFDPELLEVFITIAPDLYQRYGAREDEGLHETLDAIIKQYFTTDIKSLIR